jgi:hypothetical protein
MRPVCQITDHSCVNDSVQEFKRSYEIHWSKNKCSRNIFTSHNQHIGQNHYIRMTDDFIYNIIKFK